MDGPRVAQGAADRRSDGAADEPGVLLLDGGLASELERAGHDLHDPLWSARVLLEDPGAVESVHRAFLEAGAHCITTATYQATFQGLAARGLTASEAERLLLGAVELAVRARARFRAGGDPPHPGRPRLHAKNDHPRAEPNPSRAAPDHPRPLVAASVGPYGAYLADGSEYRGDYGIGRTALIDFHRRRWEVLARSGADVLLCETIPTLVEAQALAALARGGGAATPVWFSFTCRDESHLSDGTPVEEVAAWAEACDVAAAVGVNCTAPRLLPALIGALADGTGKPILAYPNAGGDWDAATKRWGRAGEEAEWGGACRAWVAAGAVAVGGCCRVGPDGIREMRAALASAPHRGHPASTLTRESLASSSTGRGAVR